MAVPSLEPYREGQTLRLPLLMERPDNNNDREHVIDIGKGGDGSSSGSPHSDPLPSLDMLHHEDRPSSSTRAPPSQVSSSSSNGSNSRNSFIRRGDGYGRRHRSPLNSGLWISIELVVTISQIIASIVVLSLSRDEKPEAPLFEWVLGYAAGCLATLPLLCWRYRHRNNQGTEQDSAHTSQGSSQSSVPSEPTSYTAISVTHGSEGEDQHTTVTASQNTRWFAPGRLHALVDHFKMALDCFFAVWFVVGNVWIFGGHSSSSDSPILYRLCMVFLTFSCIGYAMPFILCATICCCLPCIISVLGFQEDLTQTRGASPDSINALPTYKFKSKKNGNSNDREFNSEGVGDGGVLAAGTDKERIISGEDAVCCICLAKYADNDELRELPCSHFFHMECVDKWLKINALCPLCKCEVGENSGASPSAANSNRRERRLMITASTGVHAYGRASF
ncbi:E3 ubiquitin-protein ligase At1g63170-like isoform X2 [Telopea speciosissima]|nr:E3 ubiquitin-protein ligase At1g63170-like isoform X2 [Telopea speciosissima]XP_043702736.1 E3 ubiquitin-protein ligase At1g63170-like isoform X2 [Telopea speciosissima]